jgi:hypothetical protein
LARTATAAITASNSTKTCIVKIIGAPGPEQFSLDPRPCCEFLRSPKWG